MSSRSNFAENLRRLCLRKGSISAAARGMGIHRAQLEKYLAQEREPSAPTREKICAYLGVDEEDMYRHPDPVELDYRQPSRRRMLSDFQESLGSLIDGPPASIKQGLYHIYFTVPGDPSQLLCSVVTIAKLSNATTFRRLTGYAAKKDAFWSRFNGDHKGIVVERLNHLFFVAANQRGVKEPTLLRMRWLPVSEPMLGGHALISTHAGPSFSCAVMIPLPPTINLRTAVRMSVARPTTDQRIPELVKQMIATERADLRARILRDIC